MPKKIIGFFPHFDDETFSCGGTLMQECEKGAEVHAVYLTDSKKSHEADLGISENPSPNEVGAVRMKEMLQVAEIIGICRENIFVLNFPDGVLNECASGCRRRVAGIIRGIEPDEIFVPESDMHRDHIAADKIITPVAEQMDFPIRIRKYSTWIFQKYVKWEGSDDGFSERFFADTRCQEYDISEMLDLKNKAINQYQSQITEFWTSQDGKGPILNSDFLRPFRENRSEHFLEYTNKPVA